MTGGVVRKAAGEVMLEAIERGIALYWRTLGRLRGMELHEGDIEYVIPEPGGRGPSRAFAVHLTPETADRRIAEIVSAIRARTVPQGILVSPLSTPVDLVERLERNGFAIDTSGMCMALDLAEVTNFTPPETKARASGLPAQVAPLDPSDDDGLRRWASVVNPALFGGELFTFEQL